MHLSSKDLLNSWKSISKLCVVCATIFILSSASLSAQQKQPNQAKSPAGDRKSSVPKSKKDPVDAKDRKALAYYANAADYQNNGAFELAIEEWKKLVSEFPEHAQASTAWHHMGVCQLQRKEPDYNKAIEAFEQALKDEKLELREESLINLSWSLVTKARNMEAGAEQRQAFEQARDNMLEFLKKYADGTYVDQALFYLGDVEHILGDRKKSIAYFKRLLESKNLAKSNLRPDAIYALAVGYEEEQDLGEAKRRYQDFLKEFKDHRLANEVRLRVADILLRENKPEEAEKLLVNMSTAEDASMADYALLRLGYAQAQQGRQAEAAERYTQLISRFPNSKHVNAAALSLGQSLYQLGKYDEAVERFRFVVDQEDVPQRADAAHWLSITLMRQDKAQEALDMLTSVIDKVGDTPISAALQLDYADALYAIPGKLEEARSAYEKFAREHADDPLAPRAAYNAAFAALQGGKVAEARQWAELFLSKYPEDSLRNEVAYIAAESLLQQGEHDAAIDAYSKLVKADPKNANAMLWQLRMGVANYSARKYDAAVAVLTPLIDKLQLDPQRAEAQFILGGCYLYLEKTAEAIQFLESSHVTSDRWPLADEVLMLLSEAHQRNKDNTKAKQTLERLLEKYPNSRLKAQVEYKLAQLSAAVGDHDDAIRRYKAVVADANAVSFHHFAAYGIAWCLMQQDKYAEALEMLQPLVSQQPRDSIADEAQLAIGVCLRKLGQLDKSVESLSTYLKTSPSGTSLGNALYELGLAYTELEQLEKANAQFQRIVKEQPNYPSMDKVLYELAWNYQESGDAQQAADHFAQLAQKYPSSEFSGESRYMQAERLYEAQQWDQAAELYQLVATKSPDADLHEKSLYKLGWSKYQQSQFDQASKHFDTQISTFPDGPLAVDALFMNGECSFKQDRFEEALKGFERARAALEQAGEQCAASPQVRSLIYLHGGQCLRELKRWDECERWLQVVIERYSDSPYLPTALYELGFCKQNQNKLPEALTHYSEVADAYRTEVAARARFMMGEVYFSQRDFVKAIPEFQRVMFGFGGEKAPEEIKNWQAKSAFEAARCAEVLLENLNGSARQKVVDTATEFYEFIVQKHAAHELAAKAQTRLGELQKLR